MIGIGSGEFEEEVNGKKVGFKFGMYASAVTEKESGCGIFEVMAKISAPGGSLYLLNYMLGGMVAYNRSKKIDEEVTMDSLTEIIEGMGLEKAMNIYLDSIKAYKSKMSKNGQALEMGPPSE